MRQFPTLSLFSFPSFLSLLFLNSCLFTASLALANGNALEETTSDTDTRISDYRFNRAEIVKKSLPLYPRSELRKGIEGWVVYSVVVDKTGKVKTPILIDSSGSKGFEREARRSIKKMLYKPATLNGEAIESSDNKMMVNFAIRSPQVGAHKKFLNRYRKILKKILDNELQDISNDIKTLEDNYTRNRYEMAWLQLLKSNYFYKIDDHDQYLKALKRALSYESKNLPEKVYANTLLNLYNAQVKRRLISDALATAKKIESFVDKNPNLKKVLQHRDKLVDDLSNHALLVTQASIQEKGEPWRHQLYRHTIGIELKQGKLSQIEFRCANKIRRFEINDDNQSWEIPKKWKECTAFVSGEEGTQFEFLEQA